MSLRGTYSHATATDHLPARVAAAVDLAQSRDFPLSCRIEQGRLVHALAHGSRVRIGETGTGLGVGLAWRLEARPPAFPLSRSTGTPDAWLPFATCSPMSRI